MDNKVLLWIKKEMVLVIAGIAAITSMFFYTPSTKYLEYIDYRVLVLLFCLMAVVAGLQKNGVFIKLSKKVLKHVKTSRALCYILVLLCYFSSMWITNDVALITFVPFSILILNIAKQNKYLIYVIVMQTIAANLGSLLTPVGNPQNLYLYSYYGIDCIEFLKITSPIVLVSLIIISFISIIVRNEKINLSKENLDITESDFVLEKTSLVQTATYIGLFILCILTVLHCINYRITFIIVVITITFLDKNIFRKIDVSLLLTFICFFIFVGNLGHIEALRTYLSELIHTREVLSSILLSQIISNVPAAVLLSNFTDNYRGLVIGTNIGGLGTIIASLASLISFKFYCKTQNSRPFKYLLFFTITNLLILLILYFFQKMYM